MAYYCLHEFHWEPSKFLGLERRERAFVVAAIQLKIENDKKQEKEAKRKRKR